jgi:hypothetical protein
MSEDRPQVVFDCMIYLQALISATGPAAALLRLVDDQELALFLSYEILEEIHDVLSRPKIRQINVHITDDRVIAFVTRLAENAILVKDVPQHFNYTRDPKDEKYINLAVEVAANYIISRDRDLLDLMTGYTAECKEFRRRFRPLKIVEPVSFLSIVIGQSP